MTVNDFSGIQIHKKKNIGQTCIKYRSWLGRKAQLSLNKHLMYEALEYLN